MNELIHFIYLGASVSFAVAPFMGSRFRANWARRIFATISVLFLILAGFGLALDFRLFNSAISDRSQLELGLQVIRGFLLGCVFVLFVSGELAGRKVLKNEDVT